MPNIINSFLVFLLATAALAVQVIMADEVTSKGSKAFQYLEYLKALGASSYAAQLVACDVSGSGLLSQGVAVQHVLCDAVADIERGTCSDTCKVLVDFLSADCIRQIAEAEAQIAADFQASDSPSDELKDLITWVSAYLYNRYTSTELVLADAERLEEILDTLGDTTQAGGITGICA